MPKKIDLTKEQEQLYNELKKLSKKANQRILRLEKTFGKDTWATKRLKTKLEVETLQAWTKKGRIKTSKTMSIIQLKATIKATEQFLKSETSTVKGVKAVRAKTIKKLAQSLGTDEKDVTFEDAEMYYDIFSSDDYKWIFDYIPPSEFFALVEDAKEQRDNEDRWIERLEDYINFGNDLDLIEKAKKLYTKFVL